MTVTCFASTSDTACITQAQISAYCPANSQLIFTPVSPVVTKGYVTASNSPGDSFKSIDSATQQFGAVVAPKAVVNNYIVGASYRYVNLGQQCYGYQSNNVITCFYSYPGQIADSVALGIRSVK